MTTWICMLYRIISYYIRIVFFFTQDKKPSSFFSYYSFHNQLFGVIQRWYFWYGFLTKMMRFFGWPRQSQSLYIKRNFHKFQSIQRNFFCVTKYGDFFLFLLKLSKCIIKRPYMNGAWTLVPISVTLSIINIQCITTLLLHNR